MLALSGRTFAMPEAIPILYPSRKGSPVDTSSSDRVADGSLRLRVAGISCNRLRGSLPPLLHTNIKGKDAAIVGMYQRFGDRVAENAAIVREIGSTG